MVCEYFIGVRWVAMAAECRAPSSRLEIREYHFAGEIKSKLRPKRKEMEGRFGKTDESI